MRKVYAVRKDDPNTASVLLDREAIWPKLKLWCPAKTPSIFSHHHLSPPLLGEAIHNTKEWQIPRRVYLYPILNWCVQLFCCCRLSFAEPSTKPPENSSPNYQHLTLKVLELLGISSNHSKDPSEHLPRCQTSQLSSLHQMASSILSLLVFSSTTNGWRAATTRRLSLSIPRMWKFTSDDLCFWP